MQMFVKPIVDRVKQMCFLNSFVDNKGIGIADLVFDDKSAAEVIERFKGEKVDAVMIISCNFGNEEAAADIAKALGKPLFGEFTVRHPENKNAELLWHCSPFPLSQKAPNSKARLVNQRVVQSQGRRVYRGPYRQRDGQKIRGASLDLQDHKGTADTRYLHLGRV